MFISFLLINISRRPIRLARRYKIFAARLGVLAGAPAPDPLSLTKILAARLGAFGAVAMPDSAVPHGQSGGCRSRGPAVILLATRRAAANMSVMSGSDHLHVVTSDDISSAGRALGWQ